MDKRIFLALGAVILIPVVLLVVWAIQGKSMEGDFQAALTSGTIDDLHRDLQGKQWSGDELATVEVIKVPAGTGKERAVGQAIHGRGRIVVSPIQYEYQATVRDMTTNIVHVFGFRRSEPRKWCWHGFHPDSMQQQLQRRLEQLEEMKQP